MRWNAWRSKLVTLLTLGALTACGTVEGPAYEGEPLATFKGQLTSNGQVNPTGGVRMALAWFSHMGNSGVGQPAGIITQEVVYQGSFPLNYTFNVTTPPPAAALADLSEGGGPKNGAVGILLAYEDKNGNGKLDSIAPNGTPIDEVLGASMNFFAGEGFAVVYVDQMAGPDGDPLAQSLSMGFNLVKGTPGAQPENEPTATVVPLTTSIPIALTGDPWLNIYVCDEVWNGQAIDAVPCGIQIVEWPDMDELFAGGVVALDDNGAYVQIDVVKGSQRVANASVTFDGNPLSSDGFGGFHLEDTTGTAVTAGATHVIQVSVPGETPLVYNVKMPGDFSITSPTAGAVLPVGQTFTATWTASAGVDEYGVDFYGDAFGSRFDTTGATSWTFQESVDTAQTAFFSVSARTGFDSSISGIVSRSLQVTFE